MSYKKYYVYKKQYSTDSGATWHDYDPAITTPSGDPIATYDTLEECENPTPPGPTPSYENQYLTLKANSGSGSINLDGAPSTFYYSTDSGATWTSATSATTIPITTGGTMVKGTITPEEYGGVGTFSANTPFTAEGNAMSLLFGDNFSGQTSLSGKSYAFYELFGGSSITNAGNLELPATTLSESCYEGMFSDCWNLTTAPALPATRPARYCYSYMFDGCTSLNYIKCLATDISAYNCTWKWVRDVPSSGTFVKATSMSGWDTGVDGIPSGWTVQNAT